MADFNPDQYLQDKSALVAQRSQAQDSFNPDQYLAEKSGSQVQPTMSQGEAAKIGAEQGFGFGLRPFAAGVGAGAGSAVGTFKSQRDSGKGLLDSAQSAYAAGKTGFSEGRQQANQEQDQAAREWPKTYYGSMIGSGLLTAPLTPVNSLGQAVRLGGELGAANALSTANNVKDAAKDIAVGMGTGGLLHVGGSAVVKGADALRGAGEAVENAGNRAAAKALGPTLRDVRSSQNRIGSIGATALKEGVVSAIPAGAEKMADRADAALESKGQEFESMLNQISDAADKSAQGSSGNLPAIVGNSVQPKAGISTSAIADQLKKELAANSRLPGGNATNKAVNSYIDEFVQNNPNLIGIKDAQDLKQELGQNINWRRDPRADIPQSEQMDRALYHALNKGVEDAADAQAATLGPDTLKKWQQVKQEYGNLKTASAWANNRAGRDFANRLISPTDYLSIMGGALKGGTATGLLVGGANHIGRKFGNQLLGTGLSAAGGAIQGTGNAAARSMPYLQPAVQRGLLTGSQ
jgi:hypothetical protein